MSCPERRTGSFCSRIATLSLQAGRIDTLVDGNVGLQYRSPAGRKQVSLKVRKKSESSLFSGQPYQFAAVSLVGSRLDPASY